MSFFFSRSSQSCGISFEGAGQLSDPWSSSGAAPPMRNVGFAWHARRHVERWVGGVLRPRVPMSRFPVFAAVFALTILSSSSASAQAPTAGSLPPPRFRADSAAVVGSLFGLRFVVRDLTTTGSRLRITSMADQVEHPLAGPGRLGVAPPQPSNSAAAGEAVTAFWIARRRHAPGVALMLVGVAGVITGLLIDESTITVAGAGAGLIGLYLYLR
jgi:hypothetical protein